MTFVPVGETIVQRRSWGVQTAVSKRVALIGIRIQILRKHVIPLQLESLAKALSHPECDSAVKRFSRASDHKHIAKVKRKGTRWNNRVSLNIKQTFSINVVERCEIH